MNSVEIIEYLREEATEKYKSNIVKMGIPERYCIGVSTATLRNLAKQLDKSNQLAFELWHTNYHEARLLAVLLFERKSLEFCEIDNLMEDVISWDLCDHLCKNLIIKLPNYNEYISEWITSNHIYKKRAAFTLIASAAIHDKRIKQDTVTLYLKLIHEHSNYEHEHIKKAASWALREVGKVDFNFNEEALLLAHELLESGNKAQVWIAKDAIKELETVIKVEGRKRLISSKSKMGMEAYNESNTAQRKNVASAAGCSCAK
ncbi:DNA alkylation repair protein [Bariatricus massiliensis]|uniref:DNA alkylation repair protein n=1 Tax=Bariatricus massiliensis TaxID=1745713 RepID=A0ABS8DFI2_9FIRM|nr:DNA alkylation repair protein [Bariatricus massiliensis]MCB7303073.1 DNA alkylation repair protein [Bariatricus massiliensis]MCB7374289.1 DNA alkylation repair protein [Bariatricus massiliensis]MCB7386959.1 DNA alkylation repair protein [Bariatricus massiliensis]MCB7411121.1 DNA alkylation repair protein [Bariatricus massiliensis]